jgi:hypothetical protein
MVDPEAQPMDEDQLPAGAQIGPPPRSCIRGSDSDAPATATATAFTVTVAQSGGRGASAERLTATFPRERPSAA